MADIKINIVDPTGRPRSFILPDTVSIEKLLPNILGKLGLSSDNYVLFQGTRQLSSTENLHAAQIRDGAELQLRSPSSTPPIQGATSSGPQKDYYLAEANAQWPMLIIYLIDISGSMEEPLGTKTRLQVARDNLKVAIDTMVARSLKGVSVRPRYRLALLTYSDVVHDEYGGVKTIEEVVQLGIPELAPQSITNTAGAFMRAKELLEKELPKMQNGTSGSSDDTYPAPLVCHLTDGEYTDEYKGRIYGDPEPIARQIRQMSVPDGHVLIENIYISNQSINVPSDVKTWEGFTHKSEFPGNAYAGKLLAMSSIVPSSYVETMAEEEYHIQSGTAMFYPGNSPDLVKLAFQTSVATRYGTSS